MPNPKITLPNLPLQNDSASRTVVSGRERNNSGKEVHSVFQRCFRTQTWHAIYGT